MFRRNPSIHVHASRATKIAPPAEAAAVFSYILLPAFLEPFVKSLVDRALVDAGVQAFNDDELMECELSVGDGVRTSAAVLDDAADPVVSADARLLDDHPDAAMLEDGCGDIGLEVAPASKPSQFAQAGQQPS